MQVQPHLRMPVLINANTLPCDSLLFSDTGKKEDGQGKGTTDQTHESSTSKEKSQESSISASKLPVH